MDGCSHRRVGRGRDPATRGTLRLIPGQCAREGARLMHEFAVWAPAARRVELLLAGGAVAMERERGGWWRSAIEGAGCGTRYGFSLDAGPPRPDPRSGFQPDGVDGLSEVVDHGSFDWSDGGWRGLSLRGAVLY